MDQLDFAFLGLPEVRLNQQPVTFPTRKALALLIYVTLERRVHQRETLMSLFWPESDLERAQSSLRTTLAYIRKTLPSPPLIVQHDSVAFDPYARIDLDVQHIESAAQSAARLPANQSALIPLLKSAAEYGHGDFLDSFSLPGAPAFDDWAVIRRQRYHQQMLQILETLSLLQLEKGDYTEGLATTTRWMAFDPLDETAYQRQMQVYLAMGDRLTARQTHQACCAMLMREFGVAPSVKTETLARQAQMGSGPTRQGFDPEAECIALNRIATTTAQSLYDLDGALDLLRQALHLAKQAQNPVCLAETEWNLAHTYFYLMNLERALVHGEQAVALTRTIDREDLRGRAFNTLGYIRFFSGYPIPQVDECLDAAVAIFKRLHQRALEADCLTLKANARLSTGYPHEGLAYALQAFEISREIDNDWGYAAASYNMGLGLLDAGEIDRAIDVTNKGLMKARLAGHPPLIVFNLIVLGHIYRASGNVELALELHQEAKRISDALKNPFFKLLYATELCADYVRLEYWSEAAEFALEAQTVRTRVPYSDYARWFETKALLKGGYVDRALYELEKMRQETAYRPANRRLHYFLERALAALTAWQQDTHGRMMHLKKAEQLANESGFFTELMNVRQELENRESGNIRNIQNP